MNGAPFNTRTDTLRSWISARERGPPPVSYARHPDWVNKTSLSQGLGEPILSRSVVERSRLWLRRLCVTRSWAPVYKSGAPPRHRRLSSATISRARIVRHIYSRHLLRISPVVRRSPTEENALSLLHVPRAAPLPRGRDDASRDFCASRGCGGYIVVCIRARDLWSGRTTVRGTCCGNVATARERCYRGARVSPLAVRRISRTSREARGCGWRCSGRI